MLEFFVNPFLLGGLALASAPIIIHLLNKRRFEVHDWAAMDFLLEALVSNRRRLRFQDLLLLLLRVLLILLLVLTVARPIITGVGSWEEDERIVIVDDSFSMGVLTPTGTVFSTEAAASARNQIQDAVGGSVSVSLRRGSRPDGTLSAEGARREDGAASEEIDPELVEKDDLAIRGGRLLEQVRELDLSDLPVQLGPAFERIVDEAVADASPTSRAVFVISDFRTVDWLSEKDEGLRENIGAAFERLKSEDLDQRFAFHFVDVGRADSENTAVTGFEMRGAHALAGLPLRLVVEVTNFGKSPRSGLTGKVELCGPDSDEFVATYTVSLPPFKSIPAGESSTVEVEHSFEKPGQYLLRVVIDDDRLPGDNESYAVVTVREALSAVVIDGAPGSTRFANESAFIAAALRPRGARSTGIDVSVTTARVSAGLIEDVDLVFVLNRDRLEPSEWEALDTRVREGMGLAFFLGTNVKAEGYDPDEKRASLFPAVLRSLPDRDGRPGVLLTEPSHPPFAVFEGIEGLSLETVQFSRYFDIEPAPDALVLARYNDGGDESKQTGTPMLIETSHGKGRVTIFNTSADRDWSDWPTDPSFLISVQEWGRYLAANAESAHNIEVGETLSWAVQPGSTYEVLTPRGERIPVERGGAEATVSFGETDRAGFYRVIASSSTPQSPSGDSAPRSRWYACTRLVSESDLDPVDSSALKKLLTDSEIRFTLGGEVDVDEFKNEQEGEIWRWLAIAAALILLLELFLAWWFGRA